MARADGPVLVKGRSALDGRCVDALIEVDVVGAAVGIHGASISASCRWVIGAEGLGDVVFDKGVRGPAVDGKVAVAVGLVVGVVVDCAG